jgi:hydrogenase-4 transcriptional activator
MERFIPLLLDMWREVCRHIEIGESVARLAPILVRRLPVELILVRRLEWQRGSIETVATGVCRGTPPGLRPKNECSSDVLEAIRAWAEQNQVIALPAELARDRLPGILPEGVEGEVLAGPLNTENEPVGVLILVTQAPRSFRPEHQELLQALLEPFAVALENDHRVRELTSLREAVEADNRSLLSRLGRHDIVDSIVGAETGLKPVMAQIELVARSDAPVLVLGETG